MAMASSAKDHNGTFKGPKSFQQTKKSWSAVLSGGSHINSSVMSAPSTNQPQGENETLTSSAASPPPVDHFVNKVARPYLTGSTPNSVLIDITSVFDRQKEFIVALNIYCEANKHLWAVSEHMRRDNNRIFAEISVSPTMYQDICKNPAMNLENFAEPLMAYPTLSPSAQIVKLSLTRLPPQYGRQDGGHQQLHHDMQHNLNQFGKLIDCGYVTGGSGIYAGGGYAVLCVDDKQHAQLQHALNWAYYPIDFSSGELMPKQDQVLVLATWASMPPYCKYCHAMDHSLIDCAIRKKKANCDLCGVFGHFKRQCPRRNDDKDDNNAKKRKVPQTQQQQSASSVQIAADANAGAKAETAADTKADTQAAAKAKATADAKAAADAKATAAAKTATDVAAAQAAGSAPAAADSTVLPAQVVSTDHRDEHDQSTAQPTLFSAIPVVQHTHFTRSSSGLVQNTASAQPAASTMPKPCKSCGGVDHKIKRSLKCLKNPRNPHYIPDDASADQMDITDDDDDDSASMQN